MAGRAKKRNNEKPPLSGEVNSVTAFAEIPPPPDYFDQQRKVVWEITCRSLMETGCMIIQVLISVEIHVNAVINMRDIVQDKDAKSTAKAAAIEYARRTASELGLTISTYSRVRPPKTKSKESEGIGDLLQ